MSAETIYEPQVVLEDYWLPINGQIGQAQVERVIGTFKERLRAGTPPAEGQADLAHAQPVSPSDDPNFMCCVVLEPDVGNQVERDSYTGMLVARRRIIEIERFDRRTWGLAYGAMDVWAIVKNAFVSVTETVGAIGRLARHRIRSGIASSLSNLARSIDDERRKQDQNARS